MSNVKENLHVCNNKWDFNLRIQYATWQEEKMKTNKRLDNKDIQQREKKCSQIGNTERKIWGTHKKWEKTSDQRLRIIYYILIFDILSLNIFQFSAKRILFWGHLTCLHRKERRKWNAVGFPGSEPFLQNKICSKVMNMSVLTVTGKTRLLL